MSVIKTNNTENLKSTIEVTEHPPFEGDMKTNIISSMDMADVVSSLFAPAFADYHGCKICAHDGHNIVLANRGVPIGTLYVELYFKDCGTPEPSAGWKNLKPFGTTNEGKMDLGARVARVSQAQNQAGKAYSVTKQTYEALEEFSFFGNRTNWNELTSEMVVPQSVYGKESIVKVITGLDLNAIITKIYGDKDEETRYEYIASASTIIPFKNGEFIMQVCQLDLRTVRELQSTMGIYSNNAAAYHQYNRRF